MSPLTLTFATPSLVGDSPQARAKVKRNLRKILREAERCLGPQELDQVMGDHRRARGGRTPNESLNELVLAEWDASPTKNKMKFSEDFFQEYPQGHSAEAVRTRLRRARIARIKARRRDQKLKAVMQRPSLVGEAMRTEYPGFNLSGQNGECKRD
jgi:hypothetical protein